MCRAAGRNLILTLKSSMPVGKIDCAPLCGTAFRQTTQHLLIEDHLESELSGRPFEMMAHRNAQREGMKCTICIGARRVIEHHLIARIVFYPRLQYLTPMCLPSAPRFTYRMTWRDFQLSRLLLSLRDRGAENPVPVTHVTHSSNHSTLTAPFHTNISGAK